MVSAVRRAALLLPTLALFGCSTPQERAAVSPRKNCRPPEVTSESAAGLRETGLCIATADAVRELVVEVAETEEQQSRGLMFRDRLPEGRGMIFPFRAPRFASFWMRNTPEPLDIIFIRADGTIESIARRTTPQSLASIESGEPVIAVLEIAGGEAERLGLAPGDRVQWTPLR